MLKGWALGVGLIDVCHHRFVAAAYNGFDARTVHAVDDVLLCEEEGSGDGYGAYLVKGEHGQPELIPPLHDEHDKVALAYAEREQVTCHLVRLTLHVSKSESTLYALVVAPQESKAVGCLLRPCVHYVVGEVEVVRHYELKVLLKIFL